MTITVKFFASLREQVGTSEAQVDAAGIRSVQDVWQRATDNQDRASNILMAVNLEYVQADSVVKDGDEVAFFPPVSGG